MTAVQDHGGCALPRLLQQDGLLVRSTSTRCRASHLAHFEQMQACRGPAGSTTYPPPRPSLLRRGESVAVGLVFLRSDLIQSRLWRVRPGLLAFCGYVISLKTDSGFNFFLVDDDVSGAISVQ